MKNGCRVLSVHAFQRKTWCVRKTTERTKGGNRRLAVSTREETTKIGFKRNGKERNTPEQHRHKCSAFETKPLKVLFYSKDGSKSDFALTKFVGCGCCSVIFISKLFYSCPKRRCASSRLQNTTKMKLLRIDFFSCNTKVIEKCVLKSTDATFPTNKTYCGGFLLEMMFSTGWKFCAWNLWRVRVVRSPLRLQSCFVCQGNKVLHAWQSFLHSAGESWLDSCIEIQERVL